MHMTQYISPRTARWLTAGFVAAAGIATVGRSAGQAATLSGRGVTAPSSAAAAVRAPHEELDAALAAVTAVEDDGLLGTPDQCQSHVEGVKCIYADSTPEQAATGLAVFGVGIAGDGGWSDIMGRDADAAWHYWFGGQQFGADMVNLSQQVQVCAGGDGLNVRATPAGDGDVVGVLADGSFVTLDRFVLTNPTENPHTLRSHFGFGWYHVAGDLDGWVRSSYVATTASVGSIYGCQLTYP